MPTVKRKSWVKVRGTGFSGVWHERDYDLTKTLYRYFQWNTFTLDMFESAKLFFCSPTKWKDPYEAWWCRHLFRDESKLANVKAYGMCFTRAFADEPYWRLYDNSNTVPVIRVAIGAEYLLDVLEKYAQARECKIFLGRVEYHSRQELNDELEWLKGEGEAGEVASLAAHALMLKRDAFAMEDEHRVVIIKRGSKSDFLQLPFDPAELFFKIRLSPATSQADEAILRRYLRRHRIRATDILKSGLYEPVDD